MGGCTHMAGNPMLRLSRARAGVGQPVLLGSEEQPAQALIWNCTGSVAASCATSWEESNISAVRGASAPPKDESEASAESLAPPPTTSRRTTNDPVQF